MQARGPLIIDYRAHGDPSSVNCRFGFAVAHTEPGPDGMAHAVFDLIHFWDPADFDDHIDRLREVIQLDLRPRGDEVPAGRADLRPVERGRPRCRRCRSWSGRARLQKNVQVYERTATAALNWSTWETFKACLNMGLVHAPPHAEAMEELKFLQKPEGQSKVIPADSGPVTTKDIADCLAHHHRVPAGRADEGVPRQRPGRAAAPGRFEGGTDPFRMFDPHAQDNPLAGQLGHGLGRGLRPAPTGMRGPLGRQSPMPRGSRTGYGAGRRHRS